MAASNGQAIGGASPLAHHPYYIYTPPSNPRAIFWRSLSTNVSIHKTTHGRCMRCAVGRCLGSLAVPHRDKERSVDPLLHILLHEPCEIRTVPLPRGRRAALVTLAESYRGNWLWHYSGPRFLVSHEIKSWVESTTHVKDWLKSERSFRAPSDWPEEVESAFGAGCPHSLGDCKLDSALFLQLYEGQCLVWSRCQYLSCIRLRHDGV